MRSLTPLLLCALLAAPVVAVAQERTAGGNLQQEASWTALRTLADQANSNAKVASITAEDARTKAEDARYKADKIIECERLGRIFNGTTCADLSGLTRWAMTIDGSSNSVNTSKYPDCPSYVQSAIKCTTPNSSCRKFSHKADCGRSDCGNFQRNVYDIYTCT